MIPSSRSFKPYAQTKSLVGPRHMLRLKRLKFCPRTCEAYRKLLNPSGRIILILRHSIPD